jgi:hypothetical protein
MIYEFLPYQINRVTFTRTLKKAHASSFSLIMTLPPSTAILATCHLINGEAEAVLRATARRFLDSGPMTGLAPRIEADIEALLVLSGDDGLMKRVIMLYYTLRKQTRIQPRRSAQASIVKDAATSIMASGYRLETYAGAATNELQELDYFANMAAYALHHQELRNHKSAAQQAAKQNLSRPSQYPQIQIALRNWSNVDDVHFLHALDTCSFYLSRCQAVSYVLHLLKDSATPADDQQHIFNLMSNRINQQPYLKTAIIGQNSFNENGKEVYNTLWKGEERN